VNERIKNLIAYARSADNDGLLPEDTLELCNEIERQQLISESLCREKAYLKTRLTRVTNSHDADGRALLRKHRWATAWKALAKSYADGDYVLVQELKRRGLHDEIEHLRSKLRTMAEDLDITERLALMLYKWWEGGRRLNDKTVDHWKEQIDNISRRRAREGRPE